MHMQYMLDMRARKKLGDLMEEDHVGTPRISSTSALRANNQHVGLSLPGVYDDVLNISPRLSYHNPPPAELVNEIADLEMEVVQLERHLLSLYRRTFEQYLPNSRIDIGQSPRSLIRCLVGPHAQDAKIQRVDQAVHAVESPYLDVKMNESHDHKDMQRNLSGQRNHHILADHLGTSVIDHVPDSHFRLSEDIIRCISAVYCKLGSPPTQHSDLLTSSISSVSSSSTFSPQDPGDSWSPRCQYEGAESPCLSEPLKNKHGRHSSIVEIPKICVDGDKFDYASKMLTSFRSLIRRLDKMDPRKMEHGEQLAFWINIHNALVMHAFLAYGLHQNHMKSTSSIMKAAYNVGGHSVNACIIQRAILGCQLHRPAVSLRTLFSPAIKYLTGNTRHPYAVDRPEPLVHFALCLGAYSDPSVRVYTAKGINHELKLAKAEFIQYNVSVQKETRITLPKIIQYYAKDASLDLSNVVAMVCDCMPEAQQRLIRACLKRKGEKCVEWSPYKLDFRYLVHRDLAK